MTKPLTRRNKRNELSLGAKDFYYSASILEISTIQAVTPPHKRSGGSTVFRYFSIGSPSDHFRGPTPGGNGKNLAGSCDSKSVGRNH